MNLVPLNVLDAGLLLILGWNFLRGFKKGAVEEVFSLIGIVVSVIIAIKTAHIVAGKFTNNPEAPVIIFTGVVIYGILFIVFKYIGFLLNSFLSRGFFGLLNNLLGFLFGVLRGIVLASLLLLLVGATMPDTDLIKRSYFGGFLVPVADLIVSRLPENAKERVEKNWKLAEKFLLKNRNKEKGGELPPPKA